MKPSAIPAILLLTLSLALSSLHAQTVPLAINYQGKVTDSAGVGLGTGTPINRKMLFRIYNASTAGTRLWTEEQTVTILNGEFSVILGNGINPTGTASGESRPVLDTVFTATAGSTRYLEITVDNADNVITAADVPITPRQQLTSTAYTLRAGAADSIPLSSDLKINGTADYGLGWYGTARLFNSIAVDGPVLYGLGGGALGISNGAAKLIALQWDASRNITGPNNLTATGTVTAGSFVGNVTGNVTGSAGSAASVTGVLAGDVTGTQGATAIAAGTVTGKALTGFVSTTGTVTAGDTILTAINKLNGNVNLKAPLASPTFTGTVTAPTFSGALSGNATTATSATTATTAGNVSGIVALANGGTGSITKNFVDLTTNQLTIAGNKTFTGTTTFNAPIFTGTLGLGLGATPAATTARLDIKSAGAALPATTGTAQSAGHVVRLRDSGTQLALDIGGNGTGTAAGGIWLQSTNIADLNINYPLLLNPNGGNVGIGTATPTKGKLEVSGSASGTYNDIYLNKTVFSGYDGGGDYSASVPLVDERANGPYAHNVSIYASADVAGTGFVAFSDARIKRIEGRSDTAIDLTALLGIEVTDYTYIDAISKGAGKQKKVIAQQVEKVYPQAVRKTTDVVPDIYRKATVKDGWVALATDLKVGERVRLIGENEEGIHEVLEVREGAFRTAFQPATDAVFVYGREVKDFRSVDYEAIAMLNVSATQELSRKLEAKSAEFTQFRAELTKLRTEKTALAQKLATLEARDQAREARLTRLEAALDAKPARTVSASLGVK